VVNSPVGHDLDTSRQGEVDAQAEPLAAASRGGRKVILMVGVLVMLVGFLLSLFWLKGEKVVREAPSTDTACGRTRIRGR
jgi:hypothetical protein